MFHAIAVLFDNDMTPSHPKIIIIILDGPGTTHSGNLLVQKRG